MISPRLLICAACGMLPPPVGVDDIHSPVAVYIAYSNAVGCAETSFGNRMNRPRTGRVGGIGLRITDEPFSHIYQCGFAIAIHISHDGNFTLESRHYQVLIPTARLALRIDIQP